MQITRRLRWQLAAQSGVFVLLLALLVALLAYFAREYRVEHDVTRSARNTLSAATVGALKQLQGPVTVTAYAVRQDASGANVHKAIEERVRAYQRVKPDLAAAAGRSARTAQAGGGSRPAHTQRAGHRIPAAQRTDPAGGIQRAEFRQRADAARARRQQPGAVARRPRRAQTRRPRQPRPRRLRPAAARKGFQHQPASTSGVAQEVPANAALLVITQPQVDLQPAEIEKLLRYIDRGGNLLWLIDTEPLRGLQPLAEKLGLVLTPGTVVDPALAPRSGPPVFAVAANYARHRSSARCNTTRCFRTRARSAPTTAPAGASRR